MIFFHYLAQKCTLPRQLSSKNKPFKINFWILKPRNPLTVMSSECSLRVAVAVGHGVCFKAWGQSWSLLREAGGGSSLEPDGGKSLAAGGAG